MNKVSLSPLESIVAETLTVKFSNYIIVPQARVIKRTKKTRYEIDFYLPELFLGFEVQDFATHSLIETKKRNPWNKPMKGPAYHERKNKLALAQLNVQIVELWEDEIRLGYHENIITSLAKHF